MISFLKTNLHLSALTIFLLFASGATAQLHVDAIGEVGIGTSNSSAKLHVYNTTTDKIMYLWHSYSGPNSKYGLYQNISSAGTGSRYGIYNNVTGNAASTWHYGIYNFNTINGTGSGTGIGNYNFTNCLAGTGYRYGIYNYLACGSNCTGSIKNALYSGVSSACGGYAGYFSGDVYVSGTLTQTSDISKKKNIAAMTGALGMINQLRPKTYDYVEDENLALPVEKQYGLLAQDLEAVIPTLVRDVDVVANPDPENPEEEFQKAGTIKTVNYTGLIPILIKGMQEQQATIEAQNARIKALEARIDK